MDFVALLDQMSASLPDLLELQEDLEKAQADYEMYLELMKEDEV